MNIETVFNDCLKRIGHNIQRIKREKDITSEELATHLPFSAAKDIKDYEDGIREMGVFTLIRIADALCVKPEALLE